MHDVNCEENSDERYDPVGEGDCVAVERSDGGLAYAFDDKEAGVVRKVLAGFGTSKETIV